MREVSNLQERVFEMERDGREKERDRAMMQAEIRASEEELSKLKASVLMLQVCNGCVWESVHYCGFF